MSQRASEISGGLKLGAGQNIRRAMSAGFGFSNCSPQRQHSKVGFGSRSSGPTSESYGISDSQSISGSPDSVGWPEGSHSVTRCITTHRDSSLMLPYPHFGHTNGGVTFLTKIFVVLPRNSDQKGTVVALGPFLIFPCEGKRSDIRRPVPQE